MKSKTVCGCLAALLLCALSPAVGWAQLAGFQVGIERTQFGFSNLQPFGMPVGNSFIAAPVPFPQLTPPSPMVPAIPLVPTFPTVIVPNQVLVPGQTVFQPPFLYPSPVQLGPAPPVPNDLPYVAPVIQTPPVMPVQQPPVPVLGMPLTDVLRQF